ncbi:uncharacterized protein LOC132732231 [Ruditapes philippinarum]|uniref:uncharacterized protein LOC132732231 n=1 Tax=Ruditapes philippinarum TaxID=129788 RepID=UPI00295C029C|nr:uncharacterized protein LOC132732231 [Ruditapes philippinarum]XP_060574607.1 uncharacterized protein LOC132732231 [Ruditapes philippinarum]
MLQSKIGFVLNVLFIVYFTSKSANGQTGPTVTLTCRSCNRASSLDQCSGSITCGVNEICYLDELITDQKTVVYNAGCRAKDVCNAGTSKPSIVGKRELQKRGDLVACSACCNRPRYSGEPECNTRLCGIKYANTNTSTCYSCDSSSSGQGDVHEPQDCISQSVCQSNEACGVQRYDYLGSDSHRYVCLPKLICTLLTKEALKRMEECRQSHDSNICGNVGKRSLVNVCTACCGDGLCNTGTCEQLLDRIYNLWKGGALDLHTLQLKQTTTRL